MIRTVRSLRLAVLALAAIGATACSKDSVTGATPRSRAALDAGTPVYTQDFSAAVGGEWSTNVQSTAPLGEKFLGEFGNETATLSLNGLAAHDSVTVTFDLYIIRSWDGTDASWGSDAFSLTADGNTVLNTSFANNDDEVQNYPDALGGATHPAGTGAFARNTLGFDWFGDAVPFDATYRITVKFAHNSSSLTLALAALGLQGMSDESWGIDNVVVSIGQ